MELDARYIQVRGKLEVDKELKHGDDVGVVVTVTSVEKVDNEDGTYSEVYKAKLFEA